MTPATPKTHVMLARDVPAGVVFYRRSGRTTYCLSLDYSRKGRGYRDSLAKGSRFYGRLFPERCDLSPDGRLMVYFAMRGQMTGGQSDPSTWTAVSEPPWLRAHWFFPNGSTWGGGGVFLPGNRLVVFEQVDPHMTEGRAQHCGYTLVRNISTLPPEELDVLRSNYRREGPARFPHPALSGRKQSPVLVRTPRSSRQGSYGLFTYELRTADGGEYAGAESVIMADWAGWDIFGRLVVAEGRFLKFYDIEPRKPFPDPSRTLDLEQAIASKH
jgi:hypothetical protein